MDDQRFDALVRALGSGSSRRTILTALRAATIGGVFSLLGQEIGQADRARKNAKRQQKKRRAKDRAKAVSAQVVDDLECAAKVGLCHRTGTQKNQFQYINVCVDAVPAHAAHGDLVACPGAGVIDPETCTCVCPLTENDCPGNVVLDVDDCACVCPVVDITCPNLEVVDPVACECFCPVDDIVCEDGEALNPETCECEQAACTEPFVCETQIIPVCEDDPMCVCVETAEGDNACFRNTFVGSSGPCTASSDCSGGQRCWNGGCAGQGVCIVLCSSSQAEARISTSEDGPRPTDNAVG